MRIFPLRLWPSLIWQWIVEQLGPAPRDPASPYERRISDVRAADAARGIESRVTLPPSSGGP